VNNTTNGQIFMETINFTVDNVQFDPEADLISNNNSVVLDLDDEDPEMQFSVYPNPAKTELFIHKPNGLNISNIKIIDLFGRVVLESEFENNINIESLSSGLHFIEFNTNQGSFHKRLLKQ
jgi:hypothetical protein